MTNIATATALIGYAVHTEDISGNKKKIVERGCDHTLPTGKEKFCPECGARAQLEFTYHEKDFANLIKNVKYLSELMCTQDNDRLFIGKGVQVSVQGYCSLNLDNKVIEEVKKAIKYILDSSNIAYKPNNFGFWVILTTDEL